MKTFIAYVFWVVASGPLGLSDAGFNSSQDNPAVFTTPSVRNEEVVPAVKPGLSGKTTMGGVMLAGQELMF